VSAAEVGRWPCAKCGHQIVAAGHSSKSYHGIGAFIGPCPWDCGAQITRGFRWIRPGAVQVYRADEWDDHRRATGS